MNSIKFRVDGNPIPKQSYRHGSKRNWQPQRVLDWEELVGWKAREAMIGNTPLLGDLSVQIQFARNTSRKADLDNLAKGTLDPLHGIIFEDDAQITKLYLSKQIDKENPGAEITITRLTEL